MRKHGCRPVTADSGCDRSMLQRKGRARAVTTTDAIPVVGGRASHDGRGGDDDDDGSGSGGGGSTVARGENTGEVNLLSAGEPEEVAAYQKIFDDLINVEADYKVEIESAGDFEEQFQIRAEGGTLDVAAVPQPGAIAGAGRRGRASSRSRTWASTSTS